VQHEKAAENAALNEMGERQDEMWGRNKRKIRQLAGKKSAF
jgi:hypothetical protein